jgi:hypothetical protein
MDVYLEIGKKRIFASALAWPGWSRSGKDAQAALEALLGYGPRYQRAIASARLGFQAPQELSEFNIIEQLTGNAGTDFGAPSISPAADAHPVDEGELLRFQALLEATWRSFDAAIQAATGKELRTGPRGGGRSLEQIIGHVLEGELAYLRQLGGKVQGFDKLSNPRAALAPLRQEIYTILGAATRGELPLVGPRGGRRWKPRYYIRHAAWHILDHTWEIEDRIQ